MKRALIYLTLSVALLLGGVAMAQTGKDGPMAKLDHSLIALHQRYSAHLATSSRAPFGADDSLINLVEDRVVVDAVADGDAEALKANLEQLGMQHAVAFGRVVSGQLPVSALPEAAALATLRFARTAASMTNVGAVTSQGDVAQRSNVARTTHGVDGTGVQVGVLSDSYNCLNGAAADIATGDLPNTVTVLQEISDCSGATDEGRAMLQIVHDVAPGAGLAFATAKGGQANFATNIIALKNAGVNVIVDDLIYFAEPMFQDGIVAQAVDTVVAGGAAYFSFAGNWGRKAYQSEFRNSGINLGTGSGGTGQIPSTTTFFAHDFDPGPGVDIFQTVTVPNGETPFSLQWVDRYFSVSGATGAQTDLDVAFFTMGGTFLGATSNSNVGNDPIEVFGFTNVGALDQFQFAIGKFAGPDPSLMKYVAFRSIFVVNEFATNSGTIFGHSNAVGAEAVGAADYNNTPAFGVSPPVLRSSSSAGPTPIFFDVAGNPINDPRSSKPEIVAPNGADTTFFGTDTDGNGFPNFFGTSAAAPHAAGVAALLLEARPMLTPGQIYGALESTAIDMGAPGFDNDSGFGLIQADAALASLPSAPDTLITLANPAAVTNSTFATFNFTSNDPSATFGCSLDNAAFSACTSPKTYTRLKPGARNFRVRATAGGVTDPTPASFDWTIDKTAPNTTITSFPDLLTRNPVATFTFTSTEAGGGFQCSLDASPFADCTSPFVSGPLADGKHNFQVKAVDAAGNIDKSAAKAKAWTVDTTRPVTTITGKPTNPTTSTSATFKFTSEKKSTFQCSLNGAAFTACKSGQKYSGLALGAHNFRVQATDAALNVELTPASFDWTIN